VVKVVVSARLISAVLVPSQVVLVVDGGDNCDNWSNPGRLSFLRLKVLESYSK
jgi:hypothetical protein